MAGIYADTDVNRGVHKAPANVVIRGINLTGGLAADITKREQDMLNPVGINALRFFPGRGERVWGARTLSSDTDWKYINVRRLFIYVEKSIFNGTQWVVFEPNNEQLWALVRQTISAFLTTVWQTGALAGTTPDEAFFVQCDRTTMSPGRPRQRAADLHHRARPRVPRGIRHLPLRAEDGQQSAVLTGERLTRHDKEAVHATRTERRPVYRL